MWYKYKHIIITFVIASVVSCLVMFVITGEYLFSDIKPDKVKSTNTFSAENNKIVKAQKYYTLCGHFQEVKTYKSTKSEKLPLEKLRNKYSAQKGWIYNKSQNKIYFTLPVDKLCPRDRDKRHLCFKDNYVAVYKGPSNADGSLLRITSIKKEMLSQEWINKIKNKKVTFKSENELLQALDALDEFKN